MRRGLMRKQRGASDRRFVMVSLTQRGETIFSKVAELHKEEVERVQGGMWGMPEIQSRLLALKKNCALIRGLGRIYARKFIQHVVVRKGVLGIEWLKNE